MRQFMAFFNKEMMEMVRSGKLLILTIVFVLFGIMNPAMAKLTPWIMEVSSEALAETGIMVTEVKVDALTSWTQYVKNVPVAMIIFILMFSGVLTMEYQKGTLINMVTKGIVLSKTIAIMLIWTILYWMCFGITYGYNAYFWDNGIANYLFFMAFCLYILEIWLISLMICMSVIVSSGSMATLLTGGVFGVLYLMGLLSEIKKYLPIQLMEAGGLLTGNGEIGNYQMALFVTGVLSLVNVVAGVWVFNRRNL